MDAGELSASSQSFMETLWERTSGETSRQMSMYDIGAALGLSREDSALAAEDLMGLGLVEIRTLSGAIGLTAAALERFRAPAAAPTEPGLGPGPVLADASRPHVDALLGHLKHHLAGAGRDFDALAELVADLRSMDAQLASPRPKTAVLRACLEALGEDCRMAGEPEWAARLKRLLQRP
jgi:hypothetical protein